MYANMLSLLDTSTLDVSIDLENFKVVCGQKVRHNVYNRVKLRSILPALLNKSLSYPEDVYDVYQGIKYEEDLHIDQANLSTDLMILPAGLLGVEFVKTHIYYTCDANPGTSSCIVEVHSGVLTVILQKNKIKEDIYQFDTFVDEGILVRVHKGEKLAIPQGYFYTFINAEEMPVVFMRVYRKESIVDYSLIRRERGLAYFCIRKNAKQEIVLNPTYKNTPKIKEYATNDFEKVDFRIPLYQLVKEDLNTVCDSLYC